MSKKAPREKKWAYKRCLFPLKAIYFLNIKVYPPEITASGDISTTIWGDQTLNIVEMIQLKLHFIMYSCGILKRELGYFDLVYINVV